MAIDAMEIRCSGTGPVGTPPYINVFHVTGAGTTYSLPNLVTSFLQFYTAMKTYYPNTVAWTACSSVLDLSVVPPTIVAATPSSVTGASAGSCGAAQLSQVVTWRTASAGRSYRGRTYFGPFLYSACADGIWGSGQTTALQTAAAALISSIAANGSLKLCVLSRRHNTVTPITSSFVRNSVYTQRRRGSR